MEKINIYFSITNILVNQFMLDIHIATGWNLLFFIILFTFFNILLINIRG